MKSFDNSYQLSDTSERYNSEQSFPLIIVSTDKCDAVISLYGGQVLEFKAKNKPPLLWLSPCVLFKEGTAIRGGIPVCAPWFGAHASFPLNHGFARISYWKEHAILRNKNGDLVVTLTLEENTLSKQHYYSQFKMTLVITLGESLDISFDFQNNSQENQICEWAFHSYLAVDDCHTTSVVGLNGLDFYDKTQKNKVCSLSNDQTFNGEVDRCFVQGSTAQTITNTPPIHVTGDNCDSVIIWNPGKQLASAMKDISAYEKFVCVERGSVFNKQWDIAPMTSQSATMTLSN